MCSKRNLKHVAVIALALILTVSLLASLAVNAKRQKIEFKLPDTSTAETRTNRYTQYHEAAKLSGCHLTKEGFEKKLENDKLELWLREEIDSIRVVDKQSGYIWGELEKDTDDDLNDYYNSMANSILTLEYYDQENNNYQISLSDERFTNTYDFDAENATMTCLAECEDVGIDIGFEIRLEDDHMTVAVTEDSLQEYGDNLLSKLYLLPFFGSTEQGAMDGYLFIPDGSGALMRYSATSEYASGYTARLYGPNASVDTVNADMNLLSKRTNDYLVSEYRATVPVFGVVHGDEQYAAMTVVEKGREYATINAYLASSTIPYNWVSSCFEYRQLYSQPVSKSSTIQRPQAEANSMLPTISIYLLSGKDASYSGMALKYRSMLEEDGTLEAVAKSYEEIPLRLEVVASDVKSGFIFNSIETFTTVDEAKQMQTDLAAMGVNNLTMVMNGWQKGGASASKYNSYKAQRSVGTIKELAALRDAVQEAGGNFYLQTKILSMTKDQGRASYLATKTIAKNLTNYHRDNDTIMYQDTYLIRPTTAVDALLTAADALSGFNLNTPMLGSELYSDYRQDGNTTRVKTRSLYTKAASEAAKNTELAMNAPNVYMWKSCTDYFDIPMMNSQFLFESDSVPFLQILLKGHINYYAPYANQGFYTTSCILKTIEYGAYPSFIVMGADNEELTKTPMVDYFSLNFEDWKDTIGTVYAKANAALKEVEGASITEHKAVADGVVRVTYSNGARIYVNYNSEDCTVDGVKVPQLNFVVERG